MLRSHHSGFGQSVESFADLLLQVVDGAFGGASGQSFEFGYCIFDRVRIQMTQSVAGWFRSFGDDCAAL